MKDAGRVGWRATRTCSLTTFSTPSSSLPLTAGGTNDDDDDDDDDVDDDDGNGGMEEGEETNGDNDCFSTGIDFEADACGGADGWDDDGNGHVEEGAER